MPLPLGDRLDRLATMSRTTDERRRYNAEVGRRIKEERERAGLTQVQLERATGIPQPALSALEGGKRGATTAQVARLASALKIPSERLLPQVAAPVVAEEEPPYHSAPRDRRIEASRESFLERYSAELSPADRRCIEAIILLGTPGPGFQPDDQFWIDLVEAGRRRRERSRAR